MFTTASKSTLALALLAIALPASAQQVLTKQPTPYDRAIAAGYKALMLCGAINSAQIAGGKRTIASVEANELRGTYLEYDALLLLLPPKGLTGPRGFAR